MDYQKHYSLLIESRKQNPTQSDYYEKHHILPRSLGGDDSKDNLIKLTPREHFLAHLLLAKIHGGAMWAAVAYMSRGGVKSAKGVRVGARLYATIKANDAAWRKDRYSGKGNPFHGKTFTPEQLEKLKGPRPSIAGMNHPLYGKTSPERGIVISAVHRYTSLTRFEVNDSLRSFIDNSIGVYDHRGSRGRLARHKSPELLALYRWYKGVIYGMAASNRDTNGENNPNYGNGQAISGEKNPMWGKQHKTSTKQKIADKAKRRIECPHCGKLGNIANMHRWHLDNCKKKPA